MIMGGSKAAGVSAVIERELPAADPPTERSKLEYNISDKPELEERKDLAPPRPPPPARRDDSELVDADEPECCRR